MSLSFIVNVKVLGIPSDDLNPPLKFCNAKVNDSSPSVSVSSVIGMLTITDSEDPAGKVIVSLMKLPISVLSDPV